MAFRFLFLSLLLTDFAAASSEDCSLGGCEEEEEASLLQVQNQQQVIHGERVVGRNPRPAVPEAFVEAAANKAAANKSSSLRLLSDRQAVQMASRDVDLEFYTPHESFVSLYTYNSDDQELLIDLSSLLTSVDKRRQIMVTAMSAAGSWQGSFTNQLQVDTLHYPIEESENTMFEFRLSPDGTSVEMLQPTTFIRSSDQQSATALAQGVSTEWLLSLPIVQAVGSAEGSVVVDARGLIRYGFGVAPEGMGSASMFHVREIKSFAENFDVIIECLAEGYLPAKHELFSFSLMLLPETPMVPRAFDDRVPYFAVDYSDRGVHHTVTKEDDRGKNEGFSVNKEVDTQVSMIYRYDLKKLPNQQIRIHVDPTVPLRWRNAFREGIEAWNDAYATAGYPEAVRAVLPDDSDWPEDYDAGDVRFNTISWAIQNGAQSIGVAKVDPRSGEILKSDTIMSDEWVAAYLNDLNLEAPQVTHHRKSGYYREHQSDGNFTQLVSELMETAPRRLSLGGVSKEAWQTIIDAGLKEIVMHETGHTLGLRHNFKGSLGISFDCLLNISCTAVEGLSSSVMDYNPMFVPSTGIQDVHVFSPVVGAFDKLAIQYGYSDVPSEANQTVPFVPDELVEILGKAENYQVCLDEDYQNGNDPFCEMYDLSSDPMRYYADQFVLFAKLQKNLLNTSVAPGQPYFQYGQAVNDLWGKVNMIASKLTYWIGAQNLSYGHRGADGSNDGRGAAFAIPVATQEQMMNLTLSLLHPRRAGLLPSSEMQRFLIQQQGTQFAGVVGLDIDGLARSVRQSLISHLMSPSALVRIGTYSEIGGMSASDYLNTIVEAAFAPDGQTLSIAEPADWDLQQLIAENLGNLSKDPSLTAVLFAQVATSIADVQDSIRTALLSIDKLHMDSIALKATDKLRSAHLERMTTRLSLAQSEFMQTSEQTSEQRSGAICTGVQHWSLMLTCCALVSLSMSSTLL